MINVVELDGDFEGVEALEVCPACSALNQPMGCLGSLLVYAASAAAGRGNKQQSMRCSGAFQIVRVNRGEDR
jgi:hypothetical protein